MRIEKGKVDIPESAYTEITRMNNVTEVRYISNRNSGISIQKLNADEYLELATGEIKEFEHSKDRTGNINSLYQTFRRLRMLINANFSGSNKEAMLTLTYRENMTDFHRLCTDFKNFVLRIKRVYPDLEYIRIAEPQGRGAWHLHVLVKRNNGDFYIENCKLEKMWGHGFTFVKNLRDVDNVGAYVSAYLADIPVNPDDELKDGKPKKVIKGGRLHMYPPHMRLYTKSKGIKKPESYIVPYRKIKKTDLGKSVFESSKILYDDNGNIITKIKTIQYNRKR